MAETPEPRALTAALQGPAFAPRSGGLAMHVANRHVERWAPEAEANRVRPLRSLGFVDRLIAPWVETAQRSAALRMFSQYVTTGPSQMAAKETVSWVFPRPWYQDELDWMAAARQQQQMAASSEASAAMLTTRGTYVPTQQQMPAALFEYVAPSLSVAQPQVASNDAYSPLVTLQAAHAAQLMQRAMAPLAAPNAPARMSPGLRAVLTTMLERSAQPQELAPTRIASAAPELVTPQLASSAREDAGPTQQALAVADSYAEQRAQIAELQRVSRIAVERELAARGTLAGERREPPRAEAPRAESVEAPRSVPQSASNEVLAVEQRRIEERIRERLAERAAQTQAQQQRLHEQARDAAARDARIAPIAAEPQRAAAPAERRVPAEITAAMAALPSELTQVIASNLSARPDQAVQAIAELGDALRAVELLARNAASGGSLETTRGPRLVMPAGLGGLVAMVERSQAASVPAASVPAASVAPSMPARLPVAAPSRVPALSFLQPAARAIPAAPAPTSALGATSAASPNAIQHVAWADRWLARFAGAHPQSLDVLSAAAARPETRLAALAAAAPEGVFVAPTFDVDRAERTTAPAFAPGVVAGAPELRVRAPELPASVVRIDDNAATPDEMFAAISAAASRARPGAPQAPVQPKASTQVAELPIGGSDRETLADVLAHVAPSAPGAGLSAQLASSPFAAAFRHVMPLPAAPAFDVRALFGGSLSSTFLAGLLAPATRELAIGPDALPIGAADTTELVSEVTREVPDWQATYVAPDAPDAPTARASDEVASREVAEIIAPLTTLRTALLSWNVETAAAAGAVTTEAAPLGSMRAMIEAMTMPMLGEVAAVRDPQAQPAWTAPGMTADRAQAWSTAQERSSADLAFDFVPPELVLAARVYGLGPAEAAQAARIAIAGPGPLASMASAVDRTFVQALAMEAERSGRTLDGRVQERPVTAYPTATAMATATAAATPTMGATAPTTATTAPSALGAIDMPALAGFTPGVTSFGVERRAPRGAFLLPPATVAALGLQAPGPDSEQSMSVAALELLAAQSVAELGTYAAFVGQPAGARIAPASAEAASESEPDVLSSATTLVPQARRAKFEALYLAVSQSPAGRTLSPAARAARALALSGRGDETITARERASIAWDVLPQVQLGGFDEAPLSTGAAAARETQRRTGVGMPMVANESRPGLSGLSARAGEALGSYVTPVEAAPTATSASASSQGAVLRAPSAAQELVRTGRPTSRVGGGEVEIPAWFEQAARKMLEDRSAPSDGISLAELTLVSAAPSTAIAASTRGVPSAAPAMPAVSKSGEAGQKIDVEQIANEVYQQILVLMDAARARNGEPYL